MEELIERFKKAASELSYYNAAEGTCWSQEYGARGIAKEEYNKIKEQCIEAGIDIVKIIKEGGYLV